MTCARILAGPARGGKQVNDTTILVVDDEPQIRRVLRATLSSSGYDVIEAKDGQEAVDMVIRERPALILLDVNMPGMSGLEACSKIRLSFDGPIIMVTVRNSERDKVLALDSGADDYVVKPFTMGELLARIRAALRRSASEEPLPNIETRELNVDLEKRKVEVRGERVHLSPKEFEVLHLLMIQRGKPVTHKKNIADRLGTGSRRGNGEPSRGDKSTAKEDREGPSTPALHFDGTLVGVSVPISKHRLRTTSTPQVLSFISGDGRSRD